MPNELMVVLHDGAGGYRVSWIYFNTDKASAKEALDDFYRVCDVQNINTDNLNVTRCVLRNENREDIDEYVPV